MTPIHEEYTRGFEARALVYELPLILLGLAGGSGLAWLFAHFYTIYPDEPRLIQGVFFGTVGLAILLSFYSASYHPRRVILFEDRVRFIMTFSSREVMLGDIESLRALTVDEAKKTFFHPRYVSMSPCFSGAVELRRKRGRVWVFSVEDPDRLVARVGAAKEGKIKAFEPGPEVEAPREGPG